MSKAPPIDTSLRPGPVSRWQRPIMPPNEPSAIKVSRFIAALKCEAGCQAQSWDQLPPGETLRHRAVSQSGTTDPAFYDRLTETDQIIRFTPTPLAQPSLVAASGEPLSPLANSSPTPVEAPIEATAIPGQTVEAMPIVQVGEKIESMTQAFAIESLEPLAARPLLPADELPTMISDCPNSAEDWLAQAQEMAADAESADDLSAVIDLCDHGIHATPRPSLLSSLRKLSAWAHNRRGEMHADAQETDEAIHDFQVAISMDPNCSLAIHNRAVTLAQRNQFAAALRDFNRVIEFNPGLAVAYRNRAELLAALGRMEEAVADYSQAIDSLPDDATLLQARAHAYQRLGDFAHATVGYQSRDKDAPQ